MTIHEMRIIYQNYRYKEWLMAIERAIDKQIEDEKMNRSGRELSTRPDLTQDAERSVDCGYE